jgi:hypothetical protein
VIVFDARLDQAKGSAEDKKLPRGATAYSIRYAVPADEMTQSAVDGEQRVVLGIVAIAFDDDGHPLAREAQKVTLAVNADKLRLTPHAPVTVVQMIDLR